MRPSAIRMLLAGLAAAPLLSGCVIYSNTGGERETVVTGLNASAAAPLEAVRSARVENDRLIVRVGSNGCTEETHFSFDLAERDGFTEVAIRRTTPDLCRALVREGVELSWSYSLLDLQPGARLVLMNPQTL